ncbi:MAG: serine/threonine-protein kinase [Anaerolineales bacterium]
MRLHYFPLFNSGKGMEETKSFHSVQIKKAIFSTPLDWISNFIWVAVVVVSVGLFIFGWPLRLNELISPSVDIAAGLEKAGLSTSLWAAVMLGSETILMLGCTVVGFLLYFQRRKEVVIFFTSLVLIAFGTGILNVLDAVVSSYPQIEILVRFQKAILWSLLLLVFYIFPNGTFEYQWSRWLYAGWLVFTWSWFIFPNSPHNMTKLTVFTTAWVFWVSFIWLISGVVVLLLRSIKSSSQVDRQQTKWAMLGLGGAVFVAFIEELPSVINPLLMDHSTPQGVEYALISTLVFSIGVLLVPIGIAFSIQQKRLWEIDFLINRGLVYAVASVLIFFVLLVIFSLLTDLFKAVNSAPFDRFAVLISVVTVSLLFNPTKRWIQTVVDRLIFGIQIDYQKTDRSRSIYQRSEHGWSNRTIGRYKIGKFLHRGQTGVVYQAIETITGMTVAVKFLHTRLAADSNYRQAFLAEADTLSSLDHPNVIRFLDYGEENKTTCYLVMEYISARTLADKLKDEHQLGLDEANYILSQLASALDSIHKHGVVHLDIKPHNILLREDPFSPYGYIPILTDFGISRMIAKQSSNLPGDVSGTFDYISPEQIYKPNQLDEKADIYSLGVLAYQLVTARLPFKFNQTAALLLAHIHQPPPNPMVFNPELSAKTGFAILKAMSKDPSQRYETASGFIEGFAEGFV